MLILSLKGRICTVYMWRVWSQLCKNASKKRLEENFVFKEVVFGGGPIYYTSNREKNKPNLNL